MYVLEQGAYVLMGQYRMGEVARSQVLPGFEVSGETIFPHGGMRRREPLTLTLSSRERVRQAFLGGYTYCLQLFQRCIFVFQ
jgi:hypothetical protein